MFKLIVLCALFLIVRNDSVTGFKTLKYLKQMSGGMKSVTSLGRGIFPGTLWCGPGNIAQDDSQLGSKKKLDMCCRAHDRCDDYIKAKNAKYGLQNKYMCRSSLCECDLQFYDCLTQVGDFSAVVIGKMYFSKCKECFRTYSDPQVCLRMNLDVKKQQNRKGQPVYCAKFQRNPKWGHKKTNVTSSRTSTVSPYERTSSSPWDDESTDEYSFSADDFKDFDNDMMFFENNGDNSTAFDNAKTSASSTGFDF